MKCGSHSPLPFARDLLQRLEEVFQQTNVGGGPLELGHLSLGYEEGVTGDQERRRGIFSRGGSGKMEESQR